MPANLPPGRDPGAFRSWFEDLRRKDPALHAELSRRLGERTAPTAGEVALEAAGGVGRLDVALETIVREGRPAVPVQDDRMARADGEVDAAAEVILARLRDAAPAIEPRIPCVGRIDVANLASGASFVGTGWLVDDGVVITNRHVAELIARWNDGAYVFLPGRFGEPLSVSLDYRHELGSGAAEPVPVAGVIWIEPDAKQADLALLQLAPGGTGRGRIPLAERDADPDTFVAVIGYPARAPAYLVPDQARMDRLYGATYEVKRVAPGQMGGESRGWATHDCTTLGGNSGSVVVDMARGEAVALHFAGQYLIENYAVPASQIRRYLRERPWQGGGRAGASETPAAAGVSVTIPLTITVTVGDPVVGGAAGGPPPAPSAPPPAPPAPPAATGAGGADGVRAAALALARERRGDGVLAVRPGYRMEGGRLTDTQCLVVAAHPARVDEVRARIPARHGGFPVEVRPASLRDQLGGGPEAVAEEAVTSVRYNDSDRTEEAFSFDWIDEEMGVLLHVGPERSWTVLAEFLAATRHELVSSMYEFHAAHVAAAVQRALEAGASLQLVLAQESRDHGAPAAGDFARAETFAAWARDHGDRFERVYVPKGAGGLVATSYHIKVTVRDGEAVWLSSGNWKRSSQPLIAPDRLNDPGAAGRAGNREWHAVIENPTLAQRLRNHILADLEQARVLGGTPEAVEPEMLVDVPMMQLEAVELEAAPQRVLEPRRIRRRVRVRPLLTPDRGGGVYGEAVLALVRSAKRQLVLQNQYVSLGDADGGYPRALVEALVAKSREIEDLRIVLCSGDGFWDDVSRLKALGMDVDRCIRRLPATHTKGIVADGKQVLVGSHNWSPLGVTLNRDASLLFDDEEVARYYLEAFEVDWARAPALAAHGAAAHEGARLAEGDRPPAGFARMPLSEYLEG